MDNLNNVISTVLSCADDAGFAAFREFTDADIAGKRNSMLAVVSAGQRKETAQCVVGSALMSEIESVITVKLYGKVCSYRDIYELEDHISVLFEKLALSGDLLSRVTKLSQIRQNAPLGRLGAELELTVRTLESVETEADIK